jgi:hypothetical protein
MQLAATSHRDRAARRAPTPMRFVVDPLIVDSPGRTTQPEPVPRAVRFVERPRGDRRDVAVADADVPDG